MRRSPLLSLIVGVGLALLPSTTAGASLGTAAAAAARQSNAGPGPSGVTDQPGGQSHPFRPAIPGEGSVVRPLLASAAGTPEVVDPIVSNTNTTLKNTDTNGGSEPGIALNPLNPLDIAITGFSASWGTDAPLWYSTDGGHTWTEEFTIPQPPGQPSGCPCDQNLDYGQDGTLYGTFLINNTGGNNDVVSGDTTDPTSASAWQWNGNPVQLADNAHSGNADQPWLLVNRDPTTSTQDDVYTGYDDFSTGNEQVATSFNVKPPNFSQDTSPGSWSDSGTNPGFRLAKDTANGDMYALWQNTSGGSSPHSTTLNLNRTTDGGAHWSLNGNSSGISLPSTNTDDGDFKFGGSNALLGGVDHLAVDSNNGDVYVVYGADVANNGNGNQLFIRRLTNSGGTLSVGAPVEVSNAASAALSSVAVTADGTVGVLYTTSDGSVGGFPQYSAHFATSTDHGATWSDTVLEQFLSPQQPDNTQPRQRVLGDYQQLKAQGDLFYGTFSGNRVPLNGGTGNSVIDPVFFDEYAPGAATPAIDLSSTANPSSFGQSIDFTASLTPATATGMVQFSIDGNTFGSAVNLVSGHATSQMIATLSVANHTVTAHYLGSATVLPGSKSITQVVDKAATTTTVTSNANPSVFGQAVTLTATVAAKPPGVGTPTGSVQFFDGSTPLGSAGNLDATSPDTYSITTSSLSVATHHITAVYAGDGNFQASTSMVLDQVVNRAATATHLTAQPPLSVAFGNSVTFTATVSVLPPGAGNPTGPVVFSVDGTSVQAVNLNSAETAQTTTSALLPGTHMIEAAYQGDADFLGSTDTISYLVTCTNTITGNHPGTLVASGASTCVVGAHIGGAIVVPAGTRLAVIDSSVGGSINATSAPGTIAICGSHVVGGSVSIYRAQGLVLVGDPGDANCAVNTITGALQLENNTNGVEAIGNTLGNLVATGNSGPGPYPGDVTTITGNVIAH